MSKRAWFALACLAALEGASGCHGADVSAPSCGTPKPAIEMSVWDPRGAHATLIYNRHGDDSLTVIDIPSTGNATSMGTQAGTYDFRVIIAGHSDFIETNLAVGADACGPRTEVMQIFM
jgi:hypothetical protein